MGEYIDKLRKLVENTYELNNNTKVVLLGHSMGSPYALYMLNQQSQGWKNKYIKSLISLAGPWGGAVKVLRLYASGMCNIFIMFNVSPVQMYMVDTMV